MENILDAPSTERNFTYAGFWIRFAAYFMDAIMLWIVNVLLSYIITGGYDIFATNYTLSFAQLIIGIGYFCFMESSDRQATFGKMIVGIKVGDAQGNKISFANALGRYFAKILSAIILLIGFMMAGWDSKKQALHDKLANTYVFYA
jgi:uncharacterized RDD family membrane protein YckC